MNFNLAEMRHFDYGYASTSYSAQGATVDRVLVHMNTAEKGAKAMPNSAMAYVSLSCPRNEIKLYTDDVKRLERMLENSEAKKVALRPEQIEAYGIGQGVWVTAAARLMESTGWRPGWNRIARSVPLCFAKLSTEWLILSKVPSGEVIPPVR